jgi:hypothetical protein
MELWEKHHAYTKEIRGDQGDHGDRASPALIPMITPVLAGSSGPRFCRGDAELGDGRHRKPHQAKSPTHVINHPRN